MKCFGIKHAVLAARITLFACMRFHFSTEHSNDQGECPNQSIVMLRNVIAIAEYVQAWMRHLLQCFLCCTTQACPAHRPRCKGDAEACHHLKRSVTSCNEWYYFSGTTTAKPGKLDTNNKKLYCENGECSTWYHMNLTGWTCLLAACW